MNIKDAIKSFNKNMLVAMPTETVYGLAAPVSNLNLINKIFKLKERPLFDPLIVHVSSIEMAKSYCAVWSEDHEKLAAAFWPGPLTIITEKNNKIDKLLTAGLDTVGLRLPDHRLACDFIDMLGEAVAAPSANTFTKTSPTTCEHVKKYFNSEDVYILDGGDCNVGIESTIVQIMSNQVVVLRPGMISKDDIKKVLPHLDVVDGVEHLKSIPGAHHTHYKPDYKLVVTMRNLTQDNILTLNKECGGDGEYIKMNESPQLIARSIYSILHRPIIDGHSYKLIDFSSNVSNKKCDHWQAILNRLRKAAYKIIE